MAQYKIEFPDGKIRTLEGDAPPTEQELEDIFKQLQPRPLDEQVKGDVAQGAYGFVNEALLNVPDLLTSKVPQLERFNPGEPKDTSEKVSRLLGSGAGFAAGLPQKIGAKAVSTAGKYLVKGAAKGFIPKAIIKASINPLGKRFTKAGSEMAIGSLSSAPFRAMKEGKEFSPKDEAVRTGLSFGMGGIAGNVAARFSRGGRYINAKNSLKEAEDRLSKLTSEITQIGDKSIATPLGKELKSGARTFEELNKQIEQTTKEIFKHRNDLIKAGNRRIDEDEYFQPFREWIDKMDSTPEFAGKMEPVKKYFDQRLAYHKQNGMDLVGMEEMKENLQKLTKTLLDSSAPTEAQAVMKQGMNELRKITRGVIEKYVPEVKAINAKYEPLMEGFEATQKMAGDIQKGVKPTFTQKVQSKIPHIGESPVEIGKVARELESRLPSYLQQISEQSQQAGKASSKMAQLRPKPTPPSLGPTSWTGAVRPAPPRPGSGLVTGPQPVPQIEAPQAPRALPAPENMFGETFRTLTPEEQGMSRLPEMLRGLPEGPTPVFPKIERAGGYSPVRPTAEPTPVRGTFPLDEGVGMRIEGPDLTPYQKGQRTSSLNKVIADRLIWGRKRLEE